MLELVVLTAIGVMSRLLPHVPNFTAVGGIGLFSGARYGVKKGLVVTGVTMFISDAIVGFHPLVWATYGSLLASVLLGAAFLKRRDGYRIAAFTIGSGLLFFIVTNFAVWAQGLWYPKTVAGLIDCYVMAIPFLRNSLSGDAFYSALLFGIEAISVVRIRRPSGAIEGA